MANRDQNWGSNTGGPIDSSGDDRFNRGGDYGYRSGTHDDDYRGAGVYGGSFTAGGWAGAGFGGGYYGYGPESGYGLPGVDSVSSPSPWSGAQGGFTTGVDQMVFRSAADVGSTRATPPTRERARHRHRHFAGRGPRNYERPQALILDEVCERMARHPDLDAADIDVSVNDNVVVLTGTVPDRRSKRLAEDVASEVWGVHDVENRLTLAPA